MQKIKTQRPLLIAHRGDHQRVSENSQEAFQAALVSKADGIELDVMLSADGHVVVTHDDDLNRVFNQKIFVSQNTRDNLKKIKSPLGQGLTFLDEVLSDFKNSFSVINIELKSEKFFDDGLAHRVCEIVKKAKAENLIRFSSFNPFLLKRCVLFFPKVAWAYLICSEQTWLIRNRFFINWLGPKHLHLHNGEQNQFPFLFATEHGKWIWTVNTEEDMTYWFNQKVDGVVTDLPETYWKIWKGLNG